MTTQYCTDATMEINTGAMIFVGEGTIEMGQTGCIFIDAAGYPTMGKNEIDASERFQAAIIAVCGRAQRAAQYETDEAIEGMDSAFIAECNALFFG